MSRSLSRWQAVVLGLVVLAGLALGGFGLVAVGSRTWAGSGALHVRAGFRDVRGVEVGTRVRVQGMVAGEVVAVLPPDQPHDPVQLRLRVDGKYRHLVRGGSQVQIVSEGMIGGKVVEVRPPVPSQADSGPAVEDMVLAADSTPELADVLTQVGDALKGLQEGKGTFGKLTQDAAAYEALLALLKNGNDVVERSKGTLAVLERDADAMKRLPFVGAYIEDPVRVLVRGRAERNQTVFAEEELFEPGRAVLTAGGRGKLDQAAVWAKGLNHPASEVVVVAYADPRRADVRAATALTREQSEAVVDYLRKQHSVQKTGWWSSRKVTALGMGTQPPPQTPTATLPPARVEVLVFVPQE